MKSIIIVSKCLRVIKFKSQVCYEFDFKGVYGGHQIKKIRLQEPEKNLLLPGRDYLIQLRDHRVRGSILEGKILRFKLLDECFDKS